MEGREGSWQKSSSMADTCFEMMKVWVQMEDLEVQFCDFCEAVD